MHVRNLEVFDGDRTVDDLSHFLRHGGVGVLVVTVDVSRVDGQLLKPRSCICVHFPQIVVSPHCGTQQWPWYALTAVLGGIDAIVWLHPLCATSLRVTHVVIRVNITLDR